MFLSQRRSVSMLAHLVIYAGSLAVILCPRLASANSMESGNYNIAATDVGEASALKAVTNARPAEELRFSSHSPIRQAAEPVVSDEFVAVLKSHTLEELQDLLGKAQSFANGRSSSYDSYQEGYSSVPLVLHGEEIEFFQKKNYSKYRQVIDLAAQLAAFDVLDIRVCETWMRKNGVKRSELPPFIKTVPNGPGEVSRLKSVGAVNF